MSPILRLDQVQQFAAINLLVDPGYSPGPKIIPNACMVRLNWQLTNGNIAHNVLYASWAGTPPLTPDVAQAIFSAASTGGIWSAMAAYIVPATTFTGVTLLDMRSTTAVYFHSTGTPAPGTSAGTPIPDENAVAVSLFTDNRGPSGRGRFYLPGWGSTAVAAAGVIDPGLVTAINNWANGALSPAISANLGPLVLGLAARVAYTSPTTGRAFPARPATTVPITGIAVRDNHWDSQRRRGLR